MRGTRGGSGGVEVGPGRRVVATAALAGALGLGTVLLPVGARAQQDALPLEPNGLLRAGFRAEPDESSRRDGFDVFDVRLGLSGSVGIVFDYAVQGEFGPEDETFRLLDARLTVPIQPEIVIDVGQFKAPFGRETLTSLDDVTFLRRSAASRAISPGRNVGAQASGASLAQRLTYAAGVFNGNGRTLENDGDGLLYAARAQFNSIGPIEFYEDLVFQVGASVAFSEDSAAALGPGLDGRVDPTAAPEDPDFGSFGGERFLWGVDFHGSYRGFRLDAEYLRAELESEDTGAAPPTDEGVGFDAEGWYVEGAYAAWGALEGVARWDAFRPVLGPSRDFLLLGINLFPGYYAKLGLQLALGLDGSPPTDELADGQFALYGQLAY